MEKNRIFGLGEPVGMAALENGQDPDVALDLIEAIGVTAFREWMHIPVVLKNPTEVKEDALAVYTKVLNRLKAMDVEVTGLSHRWFLAGDELVNSNDSMYSRDLTPGSLYMRTLEMLEQSWCTLAAAFPQVEQWEVGNEWNTDTFLHPVGWQVGQPGFSEDEKMDIAVDLMYFSARGIRRGNPKAKVVSFSPAVAQPNLGSRSAVFCPPGYGIALAFCKVYERIKSGNFWSTNTDDYFDMLAWHPYLLTHMMPMAACEDYPATRRFFRMEDVGAQWRSINDMVYTIMTMNGDGNKKVLLTEMGFSDWGMAELEERQALMQEQMFEMVKTMPYVKTIHVFRLCTSEELGEDDGQFNPVAERCFGLFRHLSDGTFQPMRKAYVYQKICGGTKELK